ncbi:MAG: hypothetical protein IKA48_08725 [Fibrobacter sp.]|nr:hypothetical protein [Fibrobacter sp.]
MIYSVFKFTRVNLVKGERSDKSVQGEKAQKLVFAFSSRSHLRCKRQTTSCFGIAEPY